MLKAERAVAGCGGTSTDKAVDFAKKKNFLRLTLLTDKSNESLKQFFLKGGFVESDMIPMRMYFRENEP